MGCAAPHPFHWDDLRAQTAEEVLQREGVQLSADGLCYEVRFLNAVYLVDPAAEFIRELSPRPDRFLPEEFQILLIRYLLAPNGGPPTGVEISEKDLPGGVTFFQGPHTLNVAPIVKRWGRDPEGFEAHSRSLGAVPVARGDRAMQFLPFPEMPVTYVLWREDEEFSASVTILFDRSIGRWFELDMVFTLVLALTERIIEEAKLAGA